MMIWPILVLLTIPGAIAWAFGLVNSVGGFTTLLLAFAILVMTSQLSALVLVTIQRAQRTRRAASRRADKTIPELGLLERSFP